MECVICYEEFEGTNICITPCGHKFCFKCMMKSLNNNNTCPCCRSVLKEEEDEESLNDDMFDDDSFVSDDTSLNSSAVDDIDTITNISNINNHIATPKEICNALVESGYTMEDIVVLWTWRVDRLNDKYKHSYLRKMITDTERIVESIDSEKCKQKRELELMETEDKNTIEQVEPIDLSLLFNDN